MKLLQKAFNPGAERTRQDILGAAVSVVTRMNTLKSGSGVKLVVWGMGLLSGNYNDTGRT